MSRQRPNRTELARHYELQWLLERADAETVDCPTCGSIVGVTCWNAAAGRALERSPAHPARIAAAARQPLLPTAATASVRPVPRRTSTAA
jgi:hypothetical protein